MSVSAALTRSEKGRLKSCEAVIERGKTVFVEVGQALTEIRDAKLYRDTHGTFDAYCRERWDIGRSRAYELIDQAKVVEAIAEEGVNLSAAADMSKRNIRALKEDLPAAAIEIKQRVESGQDAAQATSAVAAERRAEKEAARHEREARQAEPELPSRDPLSPFPPRQKPGTISPPPQSDAGCRAEAFATWMRLSAELGKLDAQDILGGLVPRERARFRQQNEALSDVLEALHAERSE